MTQVAVSYQSGYLVETASDEIWIYPHPTNDEEWYVFLALLTQDLNAASGVKSVPERQRRWMRLYPIKIQKQQ